MGHRGPALLAKAVAGELREQIHCVACCGSAFVDTYVGRGASRIRKLFRSVREEAIRQNKEAAIVFMDEIDALAKARSALSGGEERDQTLNQLLSELDGFGSAGTVPKRSLWGSASTAPSRTTIPLILMAATNRADILDPALLRRMDRQVAVPLPTAHGRQAIYKVHGQRVNCDVEEIDWQYLGSDGMSESFSGADIATAVNEAALIAVRQHSPEVKQHHFIQATQKLQEMKRNLYNKSGSNGSPLVFPSGSLR